MAEGRTGWRGHGAPVSPGKVTANTQQDSFASDLFHWTFPVLPPVPHLLAELLWELFGHNPHQLGRKAGATFGLGREHFVLAPKSWG